jgi:Uncharacterised nucleotidyltransferase
MFYKRKATCSQRRASGFLIFCKAACPAIAISQATAIARTYLFYQQMRIRPMNAMTLARLLFYGVDSRLDRVLAELQLSEKDWEEILRQSHRHGVAPLLCHRLKQAGVGDTLPVEAWQKLQTLYLRSAAINAGLYRNLAEALNYLHTKNIAVIILKGGYLAQHVYANIALRSMSDFDLLVKEADLMRANEFFLELGYRVTRNSDTEMLIAKYHHLPPLIKESEVPVGIELHWRLERPSARFEIDTEGLWRRAHPAAFAEAQALALCPEDLLLHLCIHTSYHHQFRFGLRSLCDVAETIRRCNNQIDWEQLQARANEWGATKCVYLTLRLAAKLLQANVPDTVLQCLKPKELKQSFVTMSEAFTLGDIGDPFIFRKFGSLWKPGRWQDKLMIMKNSALPAKNTMARLYPAAPSNGQFNFYYLKRWKYLLYRFGPIVWQMARGKKQMTVLVEEEKKRLALKQWLANADPQVVES